MANRLVEAIKNKLKTIKNKYPSELEVKNQVKEYDSENLAQFKKRFGEKMLDVGSKKSIENEKSTPKKKTMEELMEEIKRDSLANSDDLENIVKSRLKNNKK